MFSFTAQKKLVNMQPYLRRLCDLTAPNNAASPMIGRTESRSNRAIPTLVCPWNQRRPDVEKCSVALTKDISDRGVGVILNHPVSADEVVLGFYLSAQVMPEPWYFLATRRRNCPMGGGFWLAGFEFIEFMNERWPAQLEPLLPRAKKLLPMADAPSEPDFAVS